MANDEWESRAYKEQLKVFKSLKSQYQNIPSTNIEKLKLELSDIKNSHLKMSNTIINLEHISSIIQKHSNGKEIKLSFVVIVMNIEFNGSLSKMPVFVIKADRGIKYIDMNLSLYYSWASFLKNNNLPSGKFCFPVGGLYDLQKELCIDFASKPLTVNKENVNVLWRGLGCFVAIGIVIASFFFEIHPVDHAQNDTLLGIAHDFASRFKCSIDRISQGFNVINGLRSCCTCVTSVLTNLWNILKSIGGFFKEIISSSFRKVKTALHNLYLCVAQKFHYFFAAASEWAQHAFMAVTLTVNTDIVQVESEIEQFLESSSENNHLSLVNTVSTAAAIHAVTLGTENDSKYTKTVFESAKTESVLQKAVEMKDNQNLHSGTLDLLSISNSLAKSLGKIKLKEAQDIFEALSIIVKDEYKNRIEFYMKTITAARQQAAESKHKFNLEKFNKSLGIEGNPKHYYWKEAIMSAMETRLAYSIKGEIEKREKPKKIILLPLCKTSEDDIDGLYRCLGVSGAGKFGVNELMEALKENKIELMEEMVVINETSSMIMIRSEDLTIAAMQELNNENTSESMVLIKRIEV